MFDVCTATGLTTVANEDITDIIRQQTKLKDSSKDFFPFVMKKANFSCDKSTYVFLNTSDEYIALGLNGALVKDPGNGEYVIAVDMQDIALARVVIAEIGTAWTITFTY